MELKPTTHQQNAIDILYDKLKTAYLQKETIVVSLTGAAGCGKCQDENTPIPTPQGWKLLKDIKVGDFVFDRFGKPTEVLAVFPQTELKQLYELTFFDGRKTNCTEDHLWTFFSNERKQCDITLSNTVPLSTVLQTGLRQTKQTWKYRIPTPQPVEYEQKEPLPADPYILGCYLGDGVFLKDEPNCAQLASGNDEIPSIIADRLKTTFHFYKNHRIYAFHYPYMRNTTKYYKRSDLFPTVEGVNCYALNKFIDKRFLYASIENRKELLRGLLDTDGYSSEKRGRVVFTTTSTQLALDVQELARSLGFWSNINPVKRSELEKQKGWHDAYQVGISGSVEQKIDVFRRPSKKERLEKYQKQISKQYPFDKLSLVDVKPTKMAKTICISVAAPDNLYITENYIVTHNTYSLKFLLNQLKPYYPRVACISYTASSARVMESQGLPNTSTIHSLIYKPIVERGKVISFERRPKEEVREDIDLIVLDEASFAGIDIMNDLKSFEIPMILTGDPFQLPPLTGQENPYIVNPTANLTEVVRQSSDSALLKSLTELRTLGKLPTLGIHDENFAVFRQTDQNPDWFKPTRESVKFICGTNKTRQQYNLKIYGRATPEVGDRISILKNNYRTGLMNGYDVEVLKLRFVFSTRFGDLYIMDVKDCFNGMLFEKQKIIWGDAPKIGEFVPRDYNFATFAQAATTFKVQGQTIEKIIVLNENYFMKTPELKLRFTYTALSRASKKCVLLI